MKNNYAAAQLLLRVALGVGFILPVMDRLGLLGAPGSKGVSWGNWNNFVAYANTLAPYLNRSIANIASILITLAEAIFGIGLVTGFATKWMALGAALITLVFGISMAVFINVHAPFDYPVFVFTGGAWLLSTIDNYKWSLDNLLKK